jgi:hypothetical protein
LAVYKIKNQFTQKKLFYHLLPWLHHFIVKVISRTVKHRSSRSYSRQDRGGGKTPAKMQSLPPPSIRLKTREKSILGDGTDWTSVYKQTRAHSIASWSRTSKPTREHSLISQYIGISKPKRLKSKIFPPI